MRPWKSFGLPVLGLTVLVGDTWWLLSQAVEGEFGLSSLLVSAIFLLVFAAISLRWMHETAAALLGALAVWLIHYIGGTLNPSLQIIGFEESMIFVGWNVIFLILGITGTEVQVIWQRDDSKCTRSL